MAEILYNQVPEISPHRDEDESLNKVIDDLRRAIKILKMEIERLQKEKADK